MIKAYKTIKRTEPQPENECAGEDEDCSDHSSDSENDDIDILNSAFSTTKQLGCSAHALNNLVKTSIIGSVRKQIESEQSVSGLLNKVTSILKQIKRNGQCCDYLAANKAFITLAPETRWVYQIMVIDIFYKHQKAFKHCAEEILKINFLVTTEIQALKDIQTTFEKISAFVKKSSKLYHQRCQMTF